MEEHLTDEACVLEVRGAHPPVEAVLAATGLVGLHRASTTGTDLATVDQLLTGADGRERRPAAATEALAQLVGPDMCNVQTFDIGSESLRITAQRGFESPFLSFFGRVSDDGSACGVAMGRGEMVAVEDSRRAHLLRHARP